VLFRKKYSILLRCIEHHEHVQIVANYFWLGPVVSEPVRLPASRRSIASAVSFNITIGYSRHSVRQQCKEKK